MIALKLKDRYDDCKSIRSSARRGELTGSGSRAQTTLCREMRRALAMDPSRCAPQTWMKTRATGRRFWTPSSLPVPSASGGTAASAADYSMSGIVTSIVPIRVDLTVVVALQLRAVLEGVWNRMLDNAGMAGGEVGYMGG